MGVLKERGRDLRVETECVWRAVVSSTGEEDVGRQTSVFCFGRQSGEGTTELCACGPMSPEP